VDRPEENPQQPKREKKKMNRGTWPPLCRGGETKVDRSDQENKNPGTKKENKLGKDALLV